MFWLSVAGGKIWDYLVRMRGTVTMAWVTFISFILVRTITEISCWLAGSSSVTNLGEMQVKAELLNCKYLLFPHMEIIYRTHYAIKTHHSDR